MLKCKIKNRLMKIKLLILKFPQIYYFNFISIKEIIEIKFAITIIPQ